MTPDAADTSGTAGAFVEALERALAGGPEKYRERLADQGKIGVRGRVEQERAEFAADIDILHLASELVVDAVVEPEALRGELARRFALYEGKDRAPSERRNPVTPV